MNSDNTQIRVICSQQWTQLLHVRVMVEPAQPNK